MISTCPSALKLLLAKNSNLNEEHNSRNYLPAVDQQHHSTKSITFTADFVKYYFGKLDLLLIIIFAVGYDAVEINNLFKLKTEKRVWLRIIETYMN